MTYRTRFAPSPTGPLHLGHAYSALIAYERAQAANGTFLLRIEDIDRQRSKPEWEAQIYDDLTWLGLRWQTPTLRQSDQTGTYQAALKDLEARGLIYPCTCKRRDILGAYDAPQEGVPVGPDGPVYPGTCRGKAVPSGPHALRLDMQRALQQIGETHFSFVENGSVIRFSAGEAVSTLGDIVLSRIDFLGSYHLAVVLDDAAQGITEVVRGQDLQEATKIHVILQKLLGLPTPGYFHHGLIRDDAGKRLAKRDDARSIAAYRNEGASVRDIRAMIRL